MSASSQAAGAFRILVATMSLLGAGPSALGGPDAEAKRHWAFEPLRRVEPPQRPRNGSDHPVDRFIFAKLHEQGIKPVGLADRRTLARRVYFDLLGLPPSPEDVEAFVKDKSPEADLRLIERLLASPRYGERWGRHWMDVVRYADTAGDNADYPIPEARLYRDYIIDAFNGDKPYDQFVQEQLAGDILARQGPREKIPERIMATGFLALSRRYLTAPFEQMHLTLEDTIDTTGQAFLGLTLRCARCHDHKYDPVTKEDYYALYGFFAGTQFPYAGSEEFESKKSPRSGFVPLVPPDEAAPRLAAYREQVEKLQAQLQQAEADDALGKQVAELKPQIEEAAKRVQLLEEQKQSCASEKSALAALQKKSDEAAKSLKEKLKPLRAELARLQGPGMPPDLPCAYAVVDAKPVDAYVQIRGNPDDKGPVIQRRPPRILGGDTGFDVDPAGSGRLELAQWLTRSDHPLTARVLVNRLWQYHFGKGIVGTPSNFGLRGDPPTHPELLDYLAARLIDSGWSIKAIHRLILSSKTYQLSSAQNQANASKDPGNRLYWRFDRRRLDAEAIRDAMLAMAGNLDLDRPGAHPFPKLEEWHWTQHNPFKAVFDSNHRSVYLMCQRIQRHPYLALFDAPDANVSTAVRPESTVPLQALYLMNSPFVQEQATGFAQVLLARSSRREEGQGSRASSPCDAGITRQRIRLAYRLVWQRDPAAKEIRKAVAYLARYTDELGRAGAPHDRRELEAWISFARVLLTANEFLYVD